jgi:hypothetical protein
MLFLVVSYSFLPSGEITEYIGKKTASVILINKKQIDREQMSSLIIGYFPNMS